MINCVNCVPRYSYLIKNNELKADNTPLSNKDYLEIGYMAGRFGVNLSNPNEPNYIISGKDGLAVNINACTAPLFEQNLHQSGIKFDRIA